jgi:hypothetical protein
MEPVVMRLIGDLRPRGASGSARAQRGARMDGFSLSLRQTQCAPSKTVEASMKSALSGVCEVASDHAAPRYAPLRWALGRRHAERVWSMQASGLRGA